MPHIEDGGPILWGAAVRSTWTIIACAARRGIYEP